MLCSLRARRQMSTLHHGSRHTCNPDITYTSARPRPIALHMRQAASCAAHACAALASIFRMFCKSQRVALRRPPRDPARPGCQRAACSGRTRAHVTEYGTTVDRPRDATGRHAIYPTDNLYTNKVYTRYCILTFVHSSQLYNLAAVSVKYEPLRARVRYSY